MGIEIAPSAPVAGNQPSPEQTAALLERIADLSQRWLPMLLRRAEIEHEILETMRAPLDGPDALRVRLECARAATQGSSPGQDGSVQLCARASTDVISALLRALELAPKRPRTSQRIVARVSTQVFSLLIGPPARPINRWTRLFSRSDEPKVVLS